MSEQPDNPPPQPELVAPEPPEPQPYAAPTPGDTGLTDQEIRMGLLADQVDRLTRLVDDLRDRPAVSPLDLLPMSQEVARLRARIRPASPIREFMAQITGFNPTSGTPYKWKEMYGTSAGVTTFTSGMICSSVSDGGAAVEMYACKFITTGTNVVMRMYANISSIKFVFAEPIPPRPNPNKNYVLAYASATRAIGWMEQYACSA